MLVCKSGIREREGERDNLDDDRDENRDVSGSVSSVHGHLLLGVLTPHLAPCIIEFRTVQQKTCPFYSLA